MQNLPFRICYAKCVVRNLYGIIYHIKFVVHNLHDVICRPHKYTSFIEFDMFCNEWT